MAGKCGRVYRIDPRLLDSACNALARTSAGLVAPKVELQVDPGLTVTPPPDGACPQVWRVGIDAAWAQTPTLTFSHALEGADRVYEGIAQVPPVTISRAGIWEVDYAARASVIVPMGAAVGLYVTTALFKDGALMPGTEALTGITGGDNPNTASQGTGGQAFVHEFSAGEVITLHAYRIGQDGTATVLSNVDGRTRIMAHWLGPSGDGPA